MANTAQKKVKFSKGQISDDLVERTDLDILDSSAQVLTNFTSTVYGSVRNRRGTDLVARISDLYTYGTATSGIGGNADYIQGITEFKSDNIGTNRTVFSIDYGEVIASGMFELNNIRLDGLLGLIDTGTSGSYVLPESREVYVELYGGGGGGSSGSGGRGAGIKAYANLTAGTYNYTIGTGGAGAPAYVRNNNGQNGNTSTFTGTGVSITCNGGERGYASRDTGRSGYTGALTYSFDDTFTIKERTYGEQTGVSLYNNTWSGYGAGGIYQGNGTGAGHAGTDGHILLKAGYITLKISTSQNGIDWTENDTIRLTTDKKTMSYQFNSFRYVKVEIVDSSLFNFNGTISFTYARLVSYVSANKNVVMHSFIYNNDQKYLMLFSNEKVDIYRDDNKVQEINAVGLSEQYLRDMKLTYKDDTIVITHPDIKTKQLQRQQDGNWAYSDFEFKNVPYHAFGGETEENKTVGITPSELEGAIKITADSSIFDSDYVGQYIDGNGGRVKITEYESGTVVKGYTVIPFYTKDKITSWKYIKGYEPVWSDTRGYPSTCLFAQQRLWFGGSKSLPAHIWASRLDDYNNFKNAGNYDNDSIDVTLLTNNRIQNMVENRGIHIFTSGEEMTISENSYTPDKISITTNTQNGSLRSVVPVVLSGTVCYIEKNGKSVLSYVYDYDQASYVSNNISILSNLIERPVRMAHEVNSQKSKGDLIYIVLEDGTMIVGSALLPEKIFSLSKFKTDGEIVDVCCLLEDTYIIVKRDEVLCLEKISESRTDNTVKTYVSGNKITGLSNYPQTVVYVYGDTYCKKHAVNGGEIELEREIEENVYVGLPFSYELESNPIAINGRTMTTKKRIAKATIYCKDTKQITFNGQTKKANNNFEFFACTKYSDDVRFNISGEFEPVNVLSITLNINYEG